MEAQTRGQCESHSTHMSRCWCGQETRTISDTSIKCFIEGLLWSENSTLQLSVSVGSRGAYVSLPCRRVATSSTISF